MGARFESGRYELGDAIARGGTSVVHRVWDHLLERSIAGKFMVVDEEDAVVVAARLEARATARLGHPHIVTVHDVGVWGEVPYLLMELLEGCTLAEEIAGKRLTARRAVGVLIDVASALDHAHRQGVFHLDLKPGNVHVGHGGVIKLLDFGVGSKRLPLDEAVSPGGEPVVIGTPCYMAPEQWNLGPLDARTDVWALGVLLYECLSGKLPCDGQHPGFALASGADFSVPSLSQKLGLPVAVDRVVERAMALEPARRFPCVGELLTTLRIVDRVLLDSAVHGLSSSERWLAGAADVIEGEFSAGEMQLLTALPGATISKRLSSLVRLGVLRALREGSLIRYRAVDKDLTHACFEQLPLRERMVVLDRLFVHLSR